MAPSHWYLYASHYSPDFATFLSPFQHGISIKHGLHYLAHSVIADSQSLMLGGSPDSPGTHVLLQLDIKNMFNTMSRIHIRSQLQLHFPDLIYLFDTLYEAPNICHYQDSTQAWSSFPQFEGLTQGCPLICLLATLGLHTVLLECQHTLDSLPSPSSSQHPPLLQRAYIDDVTSLLPPFAIIPYLTTFKKFGEPIGAYLNLSKSTILSTLNPTIPNLDPSLLPALSHLSDTSHLVNGTRLLGYPIGSPSFINDYLNTAAINFRRHSQCIQVGLHNLQSKAQLFRQCLQATIPHLLFSDVLLNAPLNDPLLPYSWNSPFLSHIQTTSTAFYCHLLCPEHTSSLAPDTPAWSILHLPAS